MDILNIACNKIFSGCNAEIYSFWVKKRVVVFEYGKQGKIKLGIESLEEQGALLDFTLKKCDFPQYIPNSPDAIMLYRHKNKDKTNFVLIYARLQPPTPDSLTDTLNALKKYFNQQVEYKLILAVKQTHEAASIGQKLGIETYIANYDSYIGREVEEFIKG